MIKTIKEFIKKFMKDTYSLIDVLCFFIIILLKLTIFNYIISKGVINHAAVAPTIFSIIVIVSFSLFMKSKRRTLFLFSVDILISIILVVDMNYYRYFNDLVSINSLRNLALLTGVTDSLFELFKAYDLLFMADLLLIPFIIYFRRKEKKELTFIIRGPIALTLLCMTIFLQYGAIDTFSNSQPGLLSSMRNKLYISKCMGLINFQGIDVYNLVNLQIKRSEKLTAGRKEEIQKSLLALKAASTNLSGSGKGKNVIMIQVESLQNFAINSSINGQVITPNLNAFINKSLYFDNFYNQVAAGNTADAEFMTNNSIYPASTGAAYSVFAKDKFDSLGTELQAKGYATAAFHGNTQVFWNRNVMYPKEGFQDFFSKSSFNSDDILGLGISDKSFLTQSLEKLKTMKSPFFSFLVTLSSHYPFDGGSKYGDFDPGEYKDTIFGSYLQAIHYADEQLGMFLDGLSSSGLMDNSIIVLYGDHTAIPTGSGNELYKFTDINTQSDFQWAQYQKVPLIMHFPKDANKGVNHLYSGQMDVYPTLANLFDIDADYTLGKDMLNSKTGKVIFRNGSFTDGEVFYVSTSDTYYNVHTGEKLKPTKEMLATKDKYMGELQYSDDMMNKDLIKDYEDK
ncbi:MAG TPA: LTA synthase family protein [Clostridiaceae bacterium]